MTNHRSLTNSKPTPANPPKEGCADAEGEATALQTCRWMIAIYRTRHNEAENEEILKEVTNWREALGERKSCVPNIDTQRLDWLDDQCRNHGTKFSWNSEYGRAWVGFEDGRTEQGFTLREAIDKAMASNNPPAEE